MNLLFVIRSWGIGGEQRAASLITRGLSELGHEVSLKVLSPKQSGEAVEIGDLVNVSFTPRGAGPLRAAHMIRSVQEQLEKHPYDLAIGFGGAAAIITCLTKPDRGLPIVVCERNDPAVAPRSWKLLRRIAYSRASAAVFQTMDASEYFGNKYFKNRIIIPNPIHPRARLRPKEERRPVVVNTSRLTQAKNHRLLIRGFAEVANSHPEYSLEIHGDGPLRNDLLAEIARVKLGKRIQIHSPSPDIIERIADCSVFVLSSNHEGFPNSLAEAMCLGLACISTDCRIGGPRAMIQDGVNGKLVPVGDVAALAEALDVLMGSASEAAELGRAATSLSAKLDSEVVVSTWARFLEEVLTDA